MSENFIKINVMLISIKYFWYVSVLYGHYAFLIQIDFKTI